MYLLVPRPLQPLRTDGSGNKNTVLNIKPLIGKVRFDNCIDETTEPETRNYFKALQEVRSKILQNYFKKPFKGAERKT